MILPQISIKIVTLPQIRTDYMKKVVTLVVFNRISKKKFKERIIHLWCRRRESSCHHQRLGRLSRRHRPAPTILVPSSSTTKLENERPPTQTLVAPKPFERERSKNLITNNFIQKKYPIQPILNTNYLYLSRKNTS